ncbi:hypothetical protein Moror_5250 [Moniliophthora roreri MCA 2997]|uniref:F-box domain-containing protein n=2 Tax=Moniliophthora roreri TaxID=221103 RepID=V2X9N4_MONRO|nr:hypothetical protein Moror_5250 [Moniliophthora roreri MCA 2997]
MFNSTPHSPSVSSSFGRLFPELLSIIFLLCPHTESTFCKQESPWTFIRVNRHWRNVALGTPSLWNKISLDFDVVSRGELETHLKTLTHVLRTVNGQPLHVRIFGTRSLGGISETRRFQPLIDMLLDHCEDWHSLSLSSPDWRSRYDMMPKLHPGEGSGGFRSLRAVELASMDLANEAVTALVLALQDAPALTSIKLHSFDASPLQDTSILPVLPYTQITRLELSGEYHSESSIMETLAQCHRLESLILARYASSGYAGVDITLYHLRQLQLPLQRDDQSVCSWLTLPNLEELTVVEFRPNGSLRRIMEMVERSRANLKSITIRDLEFMDGSVERLLQLAPEATTLTLEGYVFPHIFWHLAAGRLLPKLEHLAVRRFPNRNFVLSPPLREILEVARLRGATCQCHYVNVAHIHPRLKSLEVEVLSDASDVKVADELESLGACGIAINIRGVMFDRTSCLSLPMSTLLAVQPAFTLASNARNLSENISILNDIFMVLERYKFGLEDVRSSRVLPVMTYVLESFSRLTIPCEETYHLRERAKRLSQQWRDIWSQTPFNGDNAYGDQLLRSLWISL